MKTSLPFLSLLAAAVVTPAMSGAGSPVPGRLICTQFVSAPFPHVSRANGHTYQAELFPADRHYSDGTVGVFIPDGFATTGRVDVIVHFHGWRNNVTNVFARFQLAEQLASSRRNAVLVVPQGPRDAPDSGGGKLEDPDGFRRFIAELLAWLERERLAGQAKLSIGNIILSAHSGGYRVTAAILARGGLTDRIREVWLFDALYARTEDFLAWSDQHSGRLLDIYTDHGGTRDDSEGLMQLLKDRGTPFLLAEEAKVSDAELQTNKLVFLHTDLGHNEVVATRGTFERFLKTSCFGVVSPK